MLDYRENHPLSSAVLAIVRKGDISAALSTQSIIDASYIILRRDKLPINVFKHLLLDLLKIASPYCIDLNDIYDAIDSPLSDFEDAAQVSCAISTGCDAIISSDSKLKDNGHIPVLTPAELLSRLFGE